MDPNDAVLHFELGMFLMQIKPMPILLWRKGGKAGCVGDKETGR